MGLPVRLDLLPPAQDFVERELKLIDEAIASPQFEFKTTPQLLREYAQSEHVERRRLGENAINERAANNKERASRLERGESLNKAALGTCIGALYTYQQLCEAAVINAGLKVAYPEGQFSDDEAFFGLLAEKQAREEERSRFFAKEHATEFPYAATDATEKINQIHTKVYETKRGLVLREIHDKRQNIKSLDFVRAALEAQMQELTG